MKRPSPASLKRVNAENLARLGAERLAEILIEVTTGRAELKRRLRMELAAAQGAEHLLPEIDRRLTSLSTSRGAVSWRQRPAFVRDLDAVRTLITVRLAELDTAAAQDRILAFLRLAGPAHRRARDKDGSMDAVFRRAAGDAVQLLGASEAREAGARLAEAMTEQPAAWGRWAHEALTPDTAALARATLGFLTVSTAPAWTPALRALADAAGDPDVFAATFSTEAMRMPALSAAIARRLLQAGRLDEAGRALEAAVAPSPIRGGVQVDFDWETVWIDYLELSGQGEAAQAARWASFERTLSAERAKAYTKRMPDFEDVEAEQRIFEVAAAHPDLDRALDLLIGWPALGEAARLITARRDDVDPEPEQAEVWARALGRRYPAAAEHLLRRGAATAFRRRELETSRRLTEEADALNA